MFIMSKICKVRRDIGLDRRWELCFKKYMLAKLQSMNLAGNENVNKLLEDYWNIKTDWGTSDPVRFQFSQFTFYSKPKYY